MAERYAVIGDPIGHSLSPLLYNTMARELGLDLAYGAERVPVEGLGQWVARVRREGWAGFNATMPHKLHLRALVDEETAQARYFGAVNTVRNDGGRLIGHNTDGDGFARMLAEHGRTFRGSRVTVLGAGGAAGAIVRKAFQEGAAAVTICNRTLARAEALAAEAPAVARAAGPDGPIPADTDLLINTIPAGGGPDGRAVAGLGPDALVVDILYSPPRTPLLEAAEARGLEAVNGLGMLIHQAILALEFYTRRQLPAAELAKTLYKAAESSIY